MRFCVTDIVRFNDKVSCLAGVMCREKGITGQVVCIQQPSKYVPEESVLVDAGLGYVIYARPAELELVASPYEFPDE